MPLTFSVTDDGNGTTATATIAGGTVGAANVVKVGKATGQAGETPFALGGSRVGNGTVTLAVKPGLYFAYLTADGVFSSLYYFTATNGASAVSERCRKSVADTIRLLTLPPAESVYEQQFPDPANVEFPCTLITLDGVQETEETGLSTRDDIGHPVKVMIADRQEHKDPAKLADYELWREKMMRCFRQQRLTGVVESVRCKIEPYVIIDPNLPQFQYMVSGFVVRAICREPRGIGV